MALVQWITDNVRYPIKEGFARYQYIVIVDSFDLNFIKQFDLLTEHYWSHLKIIVVVWWNSAEHSFILVNPELEEARIEDPLD